MFASLRGPLSLLLPLWLLVALVVSAHDAGACGAFARKRAPEQRDAYAAMPYLAIEQTLIVWDRATRTEDFIREARFAKTSEPFGFVVPIPSKPEVSKVSPSPFSVLRKQYPYVDTTHASRPAGGSSKAGGAGGRGHVEPPPVEVLSVQRIGSFDVTVLRATEAGALDHWLAENGFAMTDEARPWLSHYVELRFHFVAFRYAGAPAGAADGLTSETVRIRFETGAPYYPYLEPEHAPNVAVPSERMLSVWLVTEEPMVPVVTHTVGAAWTWQAPWRLGADAHVQTMSFAENVPGLEGDFPIRSKQVWVQSFRDERTSRMNLGDAVMAYRSPHERSREEVDAVRPLLPVLDARIAPSDPPSSESKKRGAACASVGVFGAGDAASVGAIALVGALVIARRRARRMAAFVVLATLSSGAAVACKRGGGAATLTDPNERAVVELLDGKHPYKLDVAKAAAFVPKVVVDDLKSDPPGITLDTELGEARPYLEKCLQPRLARSVPVELDWGPDDDLFAVRVMTTMDDAASKTLVERCLKLAFAKKKTFAPGKPAHVTFSLAVSGKMVD